MTHDCRASSLERTNTLYPYIRVFLVGSNFLEILQSYRTYQKFKKYFVHVLIFLLTYCLSLFFNLLYSSTFASFLWQAFLFMPTFLLIAFLVDLFFYILCLSTWFMSVAILIDENMSFQQPTLWQSYEDFYRHVSGRCHTLLPFVTFFFYHFTFPDFSFTLILICKSKYKCQYFYENKKLKIHISPFILTSKLKLMVAF